MRPVERAPSGGKRKHRAKESYDPMLAWSLTKDGG